jgi:hypothetical protein
MTITIRRRGAGSSHHERSTMDIQIQLDDTEPRGTTADPPGNESRAGDLTYHGEPNNE